MTSPERALLTAISQRLVTVGLAAFNADGAYTAGQTGITWKVMPAAPDRVLALNVYDIDVPADPADPARVYYVQVRDRAPEQDPAAVDDLMHAAFLALESHRTVWSGVRINRCHRTLVAPMGADSNRRQERADSYEIYTQ